MASDAFKNGILKYLDSSYTFWSSENGKVTVIRNSKMQKMVDLTEKILNEDFYVLSGGIQDDGSFNASATFILKK